MAGFKFKITDLLLFTAYFAVAAWLYSLGVELGLLVWIGAIFGFEIGKRSDYPTFLLTVCGAVMGAVVALASFCTSMTHKPITFGSLNYLRIVLAGIAWTTAVAIFVWLITSIKSNHQIQA